MLFMVTNMISKLTSVAKDVTDPHDVESSDDVLLPEAHKPAPSKLCANSAPFIPDYEAEYEAQSASVDAEVEFEMQECLDAINREQISQMDYMKATKNKLTTISKQEQRRTLRTHRERSREETDSCTGTAPTLTGIEDGPLEILFDHVDDDRAAAKSFGQRRVNQFYRTKEQRDEARRRHLDEIARRSGRHPNHRNVLSTKAHRPSQTRSYEERGGRHGGLASHLSLQVAVQ